METENDEDDLKDSKIEDLDATEVEREEKSIEIEEEVAEKVESDIGVNEIIKSESKKSSVEDSYKVEVNNTDGNINEESPDTNKATSSTDLKPHTITDNNDDIGNISDIAAYIKNTANEDNLYVRIDSIGGRASLKSPKEGEENDEIQNIAAYIKRATREERDQSFGSVGLKSGLSLDIQECALGQEIINELFINRSSSERDTDVEISHHHVARDTDSSLISEPLLNRSDILSKLKEALIDQKAMMDKNRIFQSKLVEYFKVVKAKQKAVTKHVSEKDLLIDFNTQYIRYREILQLLMNELDYDTAKYQDKIEKLLSMSEIKTTQNNEADKQFYKYEENVGLAALHSRTGFKLEVDQIKDFFNSEAKKETFIKIERLSNLKLEHKNSRFDKALRSKENFEGGLRLIDFEQLKIENQTFNEKVEERREAIDKLNRKITNCNHLLSHIKEKINFTENDKKISTGKLLMINRDFKKLQKSTNKIKKIRDYIKGNNKTLQAQCGLLGKKDYLRRYEECNDDVRSLQDTIFKMQYAIQTSTTETDHLISKISHLKKKSSI